MKDLIERLRNPETGWSGDAYAVDADVAEAAAAEIERLRTELDVQKRYTNRDIQSQIEQAFETKRRTGKFPFED